jgi:hypothetical protein
MPSAGRSAGAWPMRRHCSCGQWLRCSVSNWPRPEPRRTGRRVRHGRLAGRVMMEPKSLISTAVVAALVMFVTAFLIGLSMRLDVVASLPEVWGISRDGCLSAGRLLICRSNHRAVDMPGKTLWIRLRNRPVRRALVGRFAGPIKPQGQRRTVDIRPKWPRRSAEGRGGATAHLGRLARAVAMLAPDDLRRTVRRIGWQRRGRGASTGSCSA